MPQEQSKLAIQKTIKCINTIAIAKFNSSIYTKAVIKHYVVLPYDRQDTNTRPCKFEEGILISIKIKICFLFYKFNFDIKQ